ncbi:hypothetical protein MMC28_003830 [Mycoblastus sanguinarius]|nr:hypothetical protein [Mycoblastus sanguinarius]
MDNHLAVKPRTLESELVVDRATSSLIEQLVTQAPTLRLFILYILSIPETQATYYDFLTNRRTATRLSLRTRLNKLVMVAFGPSDASLDFRLGIDIASNEDWKGQTLENWPCVTVTQWQNYGMQMRKAW